MAISNGDYDFATCKTCGASSPARYRIRCGQIHVCSSCCLHFLNFFDELKGVDPSIDQDALTEALSEYIETQLQFSAKRSDNQICVLEKYGGLEGKDILDIGCGGGLFLKKARDMGANVTGIELSDGRAAYCQSKHRLDVVKRPIEDEYWQEHFGRYDFVTLWDVIEHVNFPLATLQSASKLLKPEGVLILDTPARDSFYHRVGVFTYRVSFGRFPTFLNTMYSAHPYAHKQILSTQNIQRMIENSGLKTVEIEKFHELSFPYEMYLRKLLRFEVLAKVAAPLASLFFRLIPVKNKMIAVGRIINS